MVAVKLTIRSRLLLVIVPLVVAPLVACGVAVQVKSLRARLRTRPHLEYTR